MIGVSVVVLVYSLQPPSRRVHSRNRTDEERALKLTLLPPMKNPTASENSVDRRCSARVWRKGWLIMLGIDVSKKTLVCTLIAPQTQKIQWRKEVENSEAGIAVLMANVDAKTPWILEPTGRYSTPVAKHAQAAGREVRLAPSREAKAFLQSLPHRAKTDKIDSLGLAVFGCSRVLPSYPVKEASVDTLDQLLSARKLLSKSVTKLQQQQRELPEAAVYLQEALSALSAQVSALDKRIKTLCQSTPTLEAAKRLQSVPGIGPVTSAAMTSRLTAKGFAHPDAFVAYCGLDLRVSDSGEKRGKRTVSKRGDAELRRLLYLAAQSNLRCKSSPFKAQYERERDKGLSSTAALVAVARKLAKVCWSLHKHGGTYEESRVNVQGKSPRRTESSQTLPLPLDNQP